MWGAASAMLIDAHVIPHGSLKKLISFSTIAALIGLICIACFEGLTNGFLYLFGFSLVGFFSALLIYGTVICPHPILNGMLEYRPLRWVGKISYGLYLWHWPVIRVASDLNLSPLFAIFLEFSAIFVLATLSFYFVETRFLQLKKFFVSQCIRPHSELEPALAEAKGEYA